MKKLFGKNQARKENQNKVMSKELQELFSEASACTKSLGLNMDEATKSIQQTLGRQ